MTAQAMLAALSDLGVSLRILGGDRIAFRPKDRVTAALKAELVAHKPEVMALLTEEIAWRVSAMKPQLPPPPAPIPVFTMRPGRRPGPNDCQCCGNAMPPDPTGPGPQQCGLCVEAIWQLLANRPKLGA